MRQVLFQFFRPGRPIDPWWGAPLWALALRDEVRALKKEVREMDKTLEETLAEVQDEGTQVDGLSKLTGSIKAQLDAVLAGALTPAQQQKVNDIFAAVDVNKQKAMDAINANTAAAGVSSTAGPTG
jgi:hypothetical protein